MCLICVDYDKDRLSLKEAWGNLCEMYKTLEKDHRSELVNRLMDDAIYGEEEVDSELWHLIFQGILLN